MKATTSQLANALLLGVGVGLWLHALKNRRRISFRGRTVVITGGSRGLGLVIARQLAQEGAQLGLLARNATELERAQTELSAQGASVLPVVCDVRQQPDVEQAMRRLAGHFGRIDVLINNAGIIQVGPLAHLTVGDFEEALAIHLYGPLFTTLAALPYLRQVGGGRIVNIASIGGKIAFPHLLPYTASKFALTGLSDGLRAELRRENILVTTVCPGLMRTGSPPRVRVKGKHQREYAWFAISDALPLLSMDARRAARQIIEACRRGSPRLVISLPAKAAVLLDTLAPGLSARLLAMANRLLPAAAPTPVTEAHTGWESQSRWAPSILTRLSDQATLRNNQGK